MSHPLRIQIETLQTVHFFYHFSLYSPRHLKINGSILLWKILKPSKFVFIIYDPKIKKKPSSGSKESQKIILNGLSANLDKNLTLQNKITTFTSKSRSFRYFWNFKIKLAAGIRQCPIENRPEVRFKLFDFHLEKVSPFKNCRFFLGEGIAEGKKTSR